MGAAALREGRASVGAERDPATYAGAESRVTAAAGDVTPRMTDGIDGG
jgi:hypothetical protein